MGHSLIYLDQLLHHIAVVCGISVCCVVDGCELWVLLVNILQHMHWPNKAKLKANSLKRGSLPSDENVGAIPLQPHVPMPMCTVLSRCLRICELSKVIKLYVNS